MTTFRREEFGNMAPEDIWSTEHPDDPDQTVTPPRDLWLEHGISYEVGAPFATDKHTSEELGNRGLIGVTLIIPKSQDP